MSNNDKKFINLFFNMILRDRKLVNYSCIFSKLCVNDVYIWIFERLGEDLKL